MREGFRGYFQPSKEEFDKLWVEGEVVVDTNVLLNLFRYPVALRDDLLKILQEREDRLWLPHQVATEFHDGRWSVVGEQEGKFDAIDKALREARSPVSEAIEKLHRLPAAESAELQGQFVQALKSFENALARHKSSWGSHDEIFDAVTTLYEGKVGSPYTDEELDAAHAEGADRFEKKIPPGYKDQTKLENRQYGDYVLWKQLLEHSKDANSPVIFVTDDGKEDWWVKTSGKQRMPRPELIEEFFEASGQRIHIYSVKRFLSFAEERGVEVSEAATEEARRAQELAERESTRRAETIGARLRAQAEAAANHPSRYVPDAIAGMDRVVEAVPQERLEEIRRAFSERVFEGNDALENFLANDELDAFSRSVGERLGLSDANFAATSRAAAEAAGMSPDVFEAFNRTVRGYPRQGAIARANEDLATNAMGVYGQGMLTRAQAANRAYRESLIEEGIITKALANTMSVSKLQAYETAYRVAQANAADDPDED